jgi:ABC-2 type transport system ATP-binding protein
VEHLDHEERDDPGQQFCAGEDLHRPKLPRSAAGCNGPGGLSFGAVRPTADGDAPGVARGEELLRVDFVGPAEKVLVRFVVRRAVDGAPVGLASLRLERLAALERVDPCLCRLRDRPFFVTAWHEPECTLGLVPAALAVSGLVKRYGNVGALIGVDLTVERGELVGLLGPNGAGKSTLVKIACGLVRPSEGRAEVCGARAGTREARSALGYLAEFFRFPGWTTADELLELHQRLTASDGGQRERSELLELVGLEDARSRRVEEMSKGMQQRLGIAQALVGKPQLLLLDEPTSALDPVGRRTVRTLLEELQRRGVSVLLNSHLLSEVELVCDRVAILLAGRVVAAGTPADLATPRGVEIDTEQGTATYEDASREDMPRLVEQLVRDGRKVYGARVLTSTLEEVYVEAVGGETQ